MQRICLNKSCPFRTAATGECHLYDCDWMGGEGFQPTEASRIAALETELAAVENCLWKLIGDRTDSRVKEILEL